ncbi:MAG TPA: helix-turn-helix domain-containing protein [Solirubrobacterales bacterium]|nr:helix-turn-helix domain-containing protein [Solirubrobacterales bacterium]
MTQFRGIEGQDEQEAGQAILALLSRAAGRGLDAPSRYRDGLVTLQLNDFNAWLVAATARESKRPLIARAAAEATREAAAYSHGVPAVFAPHMTPAGIEAAEKSGVGWFDLAGNGHLSLPDFFLHVEGRKPAVRHRGRPSSPFAPRSSRVARALLVEEGRRWTQKELVLLTGLTQPTVSRTLSRLRELGLVRLDEGRSYVVTSPRDLLDAWSEDYDYRRHRIVPIHLTGAGIGLARQVVEGLRRAGIRCALTGMPAAWLYDRFSQFRLGSCYVDCPPMEAARLLDARIDEQGANFHLVGPADTGVFFGGEEVEDLPCVHPVQAYLDLVDLPERAGEAAEHLRSEWLGY